MCSLRDFQGLFWLYVVFKKIFLKVYLGWDRGSASGGGAERERDREFYAGSMLSVQSLMQGLNSQNHEIMTWAEIKSCTLNLLNHPGAPDFMWFLFYTLTLEADSHPYHT